jgi:hypothetical protein
MTDATRDLTNLGFVVAVPATKYLAAARRPYLAPPPVVHAPGVPGSRRQREVVGHSVAKMREI